jgi:hypothetical protein
MVQNHYRNEDSIKEAGLRAYIQFQQRMIVVES